MPATTRSTARPPLPEVPTWIVEHLDRAWGPRDWAYLCKVADAWNLTPGQAVLRALACGLQIVDRERRSRRRDHSTRPPTAERGRRR